MNLVAWWYYRNYHGRRRVEWSEYVCMANEHTWPAWAQEVFAETQELVR